MPAAGLVRDAAAQGAPPHLDEKDPLAVAMGYVHDAKKVDREQSAAVQDGQPLRELPAAQGKEGEQWRPCNIFPGKLVDADGWCKVWVRSRAK